MSVPELMADWKQRVEQLPNEEQRQRATDLLIWNLMHEVGNEVVVQQEMEHSIRSAPHEPWVIVGA